MKKKVIKRNCVVCKIEFLVDVDQFKRRASKYCGRACFYTAIKGKDITKECSVCGSKYLWRESLSRIRENKGKVCSRKCFYKYRKTLPKYYLSFEIRLKKSKTARRGADSNLWKGGVTETNRAIRTSFEYKFWRDSVFRRDNFTCLSCGARSGNGKHVQLNADHIKPFAFYPELRFELSNGRTLCEDCHRKTETYGRPKTKTYA